MRFVTSNKYDLQAERELFLAELASCRSEAAGELGS
jgi:hypothetical protein